MSSLKKFIYWCLTGLLICFIGVTNVFGAEYSFTSADVQYYYDNRGSSVSSVGQNWNESLQAYVSNNITTAANSYGGGVAFNSPIPLLSNHTYSMSISFIQRNNIALSSKNIISIADNANSAATDYANNIPGTTLLYSKNTNNSILSFTFKVDNNHTFIFVPFTTTTTTTQTYVMNNVIIDDLGSEGVSQQEINNSINNQTTIIQNNLNNLEQNLNNSIDNMQQNIIDSNKVCTKYDKVNIIKDNYQLTNTGTEYPNSSYGITDYIRIDNSKMNYLVDASGFPAYMCFYNINKSLIECNSINHTIGEITIPNNASYVRVSISKSYNKPQFEICKNGSQATIDKLDDLTNNLTDTNVDTSALNDAVGWLPAGPVDSIINLPLTMFSSLLNALGKTCTPLTVPLPYVDEDLEIPCLTSIYNKISGVNSFWAWVGSICSVLILYNYLLSLYHWVDDTLSLRENTMPGYYDDNFGGGA